MRRPWPTGGCRAKNKQTNQSLHANISVIKTFNGLLIFALMSLPGSEGWSFKHVLPYFKKLENNFDDSIAADKEYHGVGSYQSVSRFPFQDHHADTLLEGFKGHGLEEIDYNAGGRPGVMLT